MRDIEYYHYCVLIEWIVYKTFPLASTNDYGWLWARGWCD